MLEGYKSVCIGRKIIDQYGNVICEARIVGGCVNGPNLIGCAVKKGA